MGKRGYIRIFIYNNNLSVIDIYGYIAILQLPILNLYYTFC